MQQFEGSPLAPTRDRAAQRGAAPPEWSSGRGVAVCEAGPAPAGLVAATAACPRPTGRSASGISLPTAAYAERLESRALDRPTPYSFCAVRSSSNERGANVTISSPERATNAGRHDRHARYSLVAFEIVR